LSTGRGVGNTTDDRRHRSPSYSDYSAESTPSYKRYKKRHDDRRGRREDRKKRDDRRDRERKHEREEQRRNERAGYKTEGLSDCDGQEDRPIEQMDYGASPSKTTSKSNFSIGSSPDGKLETPRPEEE
jgi:hypothetical protein